MTHPRTVALEIIELIKRTDLTEDQKIELVTKLIQDYGEDVISDKIIY